MSERRPRRPERRPIIMTADLAPTQQATKTPQPAKWRALGPLLFRWPLMVPLLLLAMVLEAGQKAHDYVMPRFIRWDRERRRHLFDWSTPVAIVVIPLALLVWLLALILVAPISHALIARRRYIRWQETLCGRK